MKNSLIICDNHVTFITDPHIELVAHDRNSCPVGAALVAHSFAAFATVVLEEKKPSETSSARFLHEWESYLPVGSRSFSGPSLL